MHSLPQSHDVYPLAERLDHSSLCEVLAKLARGDPTPRTGNHVKAILVFLFVSYAAGWGFTGWLLAHHLRPFLHERCAQAGHCLVTDRDLAWGTWQVAYAALAWPLLIGSLT